MNTVPNRRQTRRQLAAWAAKQGTGEGDPIYVAPRVFDQYSTGYTVPDYGGAPQQVATPVPTTIQSAVPTGNYHSTNNCGCALCRSSKGG